MNVVKAVKLIINNRVINRFKKNLNLQKLHFYRRLIAMFAINLSFADTFYFILDGSNVSGRLQICDFGSSFSCALTWHQAQVADCEQMEETTRADKYETLHRHYARLSFQV